MTATDVLPEGFDFTDPDVNQRGIPHDEFRAARQNEPIIWIEQDQLWRSGFAPESGTGYYAVTRHEDVAAISKDSKNWSTAENGAIIRFPGEMSRDQIELQRVILINQDPPEHATTRQIISRGFTPRSINELEETMIKRAAQIVQDSVAKGTGNFVEDVAAELPLQAIADLLGVPMEDRHKLFEWSNLMLAGEDPDYEGANDVAAAEILGYAMMLAAERQANPRDDLITKLINAHKGERGLTDDEFGYFVILLAVAGNETTRNAITHGMNAFFDHPEQWEIWKRDRPATMIDEVVRWATPVTVFQRTALHDVELGGVQFKKGQRAALFYASANFDETVFEDPFRFDITRETNPQLGFGGHGNHYCLGANLARQEIKVIFDALADYAPDITRLAPAARLRHSWVNGIKDLQVQYGA
ncbi:cytochrome P450 [Nocardioides lianchengensis]|uniref:Cholest-4-en-3-one 26-monooxygenase n=1 Tax=Nocardioides lianchengensis TaxID=1045774 RepID=A0A1G6SD33_9ACTN|nr:cytochrome P450 [Nocardioides lianchengensis]NYG09779.1 cholest-4-en-3-one 26-monooxygenase [Nocardioides lianchengensis]SDD14116.1 cholest-4-en-3-one 26-monooxygenase [Nocardioides lianchengensis]